MGSPINIRFFFISVFGVFLSKPKNVRTKTTNLWFISLNVIKALPRYQRPGRPISVRAIPFGPGNDIWRSCRFVGALMRSFCTLLGCLGGFMPCAIGATYCRLRHIGWERCGHGPRESASKAFLSGLLQLFRCPPGSALRYLLVLCLLGFALYGLPVGSPLGVCQYFGMLLALLLLVWCGWCCWGCAWGWGVSWVSGSGPGRKRIRLNTKICTHLVDISGAQPRPRVWKRLRHVGQHSPMLQGLHAFN